MTPSPVAGLQGGITIGNLSVQGHSSLVGPAAGHVPDRVPPSSQHQHGQVKALHKLHALGVACGAKNKGSGSRHRCQLFPGMPCCACGSPAPTFDGEVEAAQPVPRQRIGAALQDHGAGLERLHHLGDHLNNKGPVTPCPQGAVTRQHGARQAREATPGAPTAANTVALTPSGSRTDPHCSGGNRALGEL